MVRSAGTMVGMETETQNLTSALVANLRDAADWLDAHPEVPEPYSIHSYPHLGVSISWRVQTDGEAEAIHAHTDRVQSDHSYGSGDAARILTGHVGDSLELWAVVERVSA